MTNRRLYFASCGIMAIGIGSCNTGTLFPVSDVPCFQPTAWSLPEAGGGEAVRVVPGADGVILITNQTSAQIQQDFRDGDGMVTFFPHDPVYRFSPDTGAIELVDDSVWDDLTTPISDCSLSIGDTTPFGNAGFGRPSLLFEGEVVPVVGGALVSMDSAPESAVIAVESTDGSFGLDLPFVPSGTSDGQHFHQLFSKLDGSPVGEAVRIGIGQDNPCWTLDEKYVIYKGRNSNSESTVCIVAIEDELPQFGN